MSDNKLYICNLCGEKVKNRNNHIFSLHPEFSTDFKNSEGSYFKYLQLPIAPNIYVYPIKEVPIRTANLTSHSFYWDDINFKNRSIEIYIKRSGIRFHSIECKSSIEALNKIKEEFFITHHGHKLYKLISEDRKININRSEDINKILTLIDAIIELYEFRYAGNKKSRALSEKNLELLSNEQIFSLIIMNENKSKYLNYLYGLHSKNHKLIPILESIGSALEESFIFRIQSGENKIFAIWENVNPARATYIFQIDSSQDKFRNLLKYITEKEQSKRLFLKGNKNLKWAITNLGLIGNINHEGLENHKNQLFKILNNCQ